MNKIFDLSNKRILLVGATGVLGRGYAKSLANTGAKLVIADTNETDIKSLADDLEVDYVEIDVSSEDSVIKAIKSVSNILNGLDGVINNAAATGEGLMKSGEVFSDFENYPLSVWQKTLDVNLTGSFLVAREAGKLIKTSSKNGTIINISSIYGVVGPDHSIYQDQPFKSFPGYSASKSGIIGLTKWLSTWWAKDNIRVNCVTPGGVFNNHNEDFVSSYSNRTPMGRMANRDELIGIIIYLLSDSSSYVTGQNFIVDGGYTAW
jgi:NAD(P)-dependent dehydrogenase (short-subunit alcohol dehydrogenase family)